MKKIIVEVEIECEDNFSVSAWMGVLNGYFSNAKFSVLRQDEAAQQGVQWTAEADEPDMVIPWRCRNCDAINAHDDANCKACEEPRHR